MLALANTSRGRRNPYFEKSGRIWLDYIITNGNKFNIISFWDKPENNKLDTNYIDEILKHSNMPELEWDNTLIDYDEQSDVRLKYGEMKQNIKINYGGKSDYYKHIIGGLADRKSMGSKKRKN